MIPKAILTILCLFFLITTYAQVSYSYDNAGNRIKREILLDKSAENVSDSTNYTETVIKNETVALEFTNPVLEEEFGELEVKLYPNPTEGAVFIRLNKLPDEGQPRIEIWSPNGALIEKARITGLITRLNLLGRPSGIYFVKSTLNGSPVTWKIIKK